MANKHKKSQQTNTLRIIAGRWRGRQLVFADVPGLRPTADRIRETLFNWLQSEVPGSRCLDLFSGSGALGLEALSRGAAQVTFLEKAPAAIEVLARQLSLLQAHKEAKVMRIDALEYLATPPDSAFDLVFLDPPFNENLWQICCEKLHRGRYLKPGALIYIEQDKKSPILDLPQNWEVVKQKTAGNVCFQLVKAALKTK